MKHHKAEAKGEEGLRGAFGYESDIVTVAGGNKSYK